MNSSRQRTKLLIYRLILTANKARFLIQFISLQEKSSVRDQCTLGKKWLLRRDLLRSKKPADQSDSMHARLAWSVNSDKLGGHTHLTKSILFLSLQIWEEKKGTKNAHSYLWSCSQSCGVRLRKRRVLKAVFFKYQLKLVPGKPDKVMIIGN